MERSLKAWRHEQGRQRGLGSRFFAEWSESGIRTKENHRKKKIAVREGADALVKKRRGDGTTWAGLHVCRTLLTRTRISIGTDKSLEMVTQALPEPTLEKNRLHRVLGRVCCSQTHVSAGIVENSTFTKATANSSFHKRTASFSHLQETHTVPQETRTFPQRGPMICVDTLVEPTDGAQRCVRVGVDKRPHQKKHRIIRQENQWCLMFRIGHRYLKGKACSAPFQEKSTRRCYEGGIWRPKQK